MSKEITHGNEARAKIKAGIDKAANAVAPTLGAVGMSAMIEFPGLDPIQADDGVTILKNIELEDQYENMGVQTLRKAAVRTSEEGGDGTATTTILTQALVNQAFKEIETDSSKIREVRERLEVGLKDVLEQLSGLKRDITEDDIERIATISSLDPEVATLIADVIKEVGVSGVVTVERGAQLGYTKEVVKGARFDSGLISPFFINDHEHKQTVLEDAFIVLVDRKVSTNEQIMNLLTTIGTGQDILFIATDVESVALGTLAQNAVNKIADIACVRNPLTASAGRDFLFDMAALTGATVISEEMGMKLDTADVKLCGRAEKVIVTKDTTTIIGGQAGETLEARVKDIERQISETTSEYQKMMLKDRLAQLTGGIGVIRVGAYTDTEFNAKKYKFQNAINATQAALQEGIVPGGGAALWQVIPSEPMFHEVMRAPFRQMAKNAGVTPDGWAFEPEWGLDFKTKNVVNMFEAGIIDPFKVTRLALESATAIAMSLVGTETVIITKKTE
jgi:chaperonin GroEL